MSRNEIITSLFHDKRFNDCINKMDPDHLREDLKSEVIMILLEKPEQEIISLSDRDRLIHYANKIVSNLVNQKKNGFYNTYRIKTVELNGSQQTSEELDLSFIEAEQKKEWVYDLIAEIKKIENAPKPPKYIKHLDDLHIQTEGKEGVSWYSQRFLSLYMNLGSRRAVAKNVGIPHDSCGFAIKQAVEQLKRYVKRTNNYLSSIHCFLFC